MRAGEEEMDGVGSVQQHQQLPAGTWKISFALNSPPKTRGGRPQGGLVLGFSGSVRCCCHWWGGNSGRRSLCLPA